MISLLQRVTRAKVTVDNRIVGQIDNGLLVFVAFEHADGKAQLKRMLSRLLGYRVFSDSVGKMNRNLVDVGGGLLLVPQFTLAADTSRGMRPSFSRAAEPKMAETLFNLLHEQAVQAHSRVSAGRFSADMQVELINDGPVTFWLHVPPEQAC